VHVQDGTTGANQVHYLFADHLGNTNVTYNTANSTSTAQRYYPWGTVRPGPNNALPTGYTYTGQLDSGLGLMYYGARFYDGALGRFISPDTIVPEPGNPQALNRYSYVLNNPLRYTDPTGMFSEDEIMGYLGVSTWDDVLAMFGEGGVMAGAWGFLEVLRQAELGDNISMWMDALNSTQALPFLAGGFYEQDGQLMFGGTMQIGDNTWQATMGVVAFASLSGNGSPTRFWVQGATTNAYLYNIQYGHLKFEDADDIDWAGASLDVASIGADAVSLGVGGRIIKGVAVGAKAQDISRALNWIDVGYSLGDVGQGIASGNLSVDQGKSLGYSVFGFVPIVGTGVSVVSLLDNVLKVEP
jgi:RHS repeat-associated protein